MASFFDQLLDSSNHKNMTVYMRQFSYKNITSKCYLAQDKIRSSCLNEVVCKYGNLYGNVWLLFLVFYFFNFSILLYNFNFLIINWSSLRSPAARHCVSNLHGYVVFIFLIEKMHVMFCSKWNEKSTKLSLSFLGSYLQLDLYMCATPGVGLSLFNEFSCVFFTDGQMIYDQLAYTF